MGGMRMGMRVIIMGGFRERGVWKRRRVGGVGGFEGFSDEGVAGWVVHWLIAWLGDTC